MPMSVSRILWGSTYENSLDFGWPLDQVITGSLPRDGSEWVQSISGVEDSWITGKDYYLSGLARWFPPMDVPSPTQSGWTGSRGMQAFLDYARFKNTFRFVPNIANPLFYVDGCYLAKPVDTTTLAALEPDATQQIQLLMRNPTLDFGLALRGLMFEYAPGADISTLGLNGTFANAGVSGFLNNAGLFESTVVNQLKDRHYPLGFSAGAPVLPKVTLLQGAATNKLTAPEDLSNGAWVKTQATVPSINNPSPRNGDLTASFLREDTTVNGIHWAAQNFTIIAGHTIGGTRFFKANGRTKVDWIFANANVVGMSNFFGVIVDTVAGTATATTSGSGVATFVSVVPIGSGWWAATVYGTVDGSTTSVWDINALMSGAQTAYTGDGASGMFIWGCVATDNQPAGMYWGTGASRSADVFSFPHTFVPQPLWLYAKLIETGAAQTLGYPALLEISNGAGATPMTKLFSEKSNGHATYGFTFWNTVNNECDPISGPTIGDTVEVFGLINPDGSTQVRLSINGAADIVSSQAATQSFPAAWSAATLWLGTPGGATGNLGLVQAKVGLRIIGSQIINTVPLARAA